MGRGPCWTAEESARIRELLAAGVSRDAIARELGRTRRALNQQIQRLGLAGPKPRPWTSEEDARLLDLLDNHTPYEQIAAKLGRTQTAVEIRIARLGYDYLSKVNGWTINRVARVIFGSPGCRGTVMRWVKRGWLRAVYAGVEVNTPMGKRKVQVVEYDDLLAFLEDERFWHEWEPMRIRDYHLRNWTTELRAGKRYLTTGEVAERTGYSYGWIWVCIQRGWIRAVRRGPHWFVREDWLPTRAVLSDRWICIVRCAICGEELARRGGIPTRERNDNAVSVIGDLLNAVCRRWAHNVLDFGVVTKIEWVEERVTAEFPTRRRRGRPPRRGVPATSAVG